MKKKEGTLENLYHYFDCERYAQTAKLSHTKRFNDINQIRTKLFSMTDDEYEKAIFGILKILDSGQIHETSKKSAKPSKNEHIKLSAKELR